MVWRSVGIALVVACAKERAPARPIESAPVLTTPPDAGCAKVGLWERCNLEDRLVRAGLVITLEDSLFRSDLFSIPGLRYKVGAGEDRLDLFVFASSQARERETSVLDSVAVSRRGERRAYAVPPMLVTSNNIAAVVTTMNERARERMALALSAGLPPKR